MSSQSNDSAGASPAQKPGRSGRTRRYVPAVGPRLRKLLWAVFGLFALLGVTAVYLGSITLLEWMTGQTYQNYVYQYMFLLHLALGLLFILPVLIFGFIHLSNARGRRNRRAVRAGYALFTSVVLVLVSGVLLTRVEGLIAVRDPRVREVAYWLHLIAPVVAAWLFVLHRLAGPRIRWRIGGVWGTVAVVFAAIMMLLHLQDPRRWNVEGPASGEKYFAPSLSKTKSGDFIPAKALNNDEYCKQCHQDIHENWSHSVHHFSSFNNPAYEESVLATRRKMFERDGSVKASRWCAGCHDPVPFFTGAFDDPKFDDPDYDLASDPQAQAGITCTSCHAITHVNSVRGNGDYTIEEPMQYPFAYSESEFLQWLNRTLIKAKPEFHKKTFLKPLHRSPEFCATCHKVHLPEELNDYKFLRGQNHYDSYHLSGVSGHGVSSFYYPDQAVHSCNTCHMPLRESDDFGADFFDDSGKLKVHDHQFPSANTAIPHLVGMPEKVNNKHRAFLEGVMRVDIFGLKSGGRISGELHAPLRPEVPALEPGADYLLETVIRTMKMGHHFTQGTIDSNQVWMDVTLKQGDRVIGRSGGMRENGEVDPWSHFVNAFVVDREGNRIAFRNPEDIFTKLYDNQIPPGAADVVHYSFTVPEGATEPVTAEVKLRYRKFDTTYMKYFQGEEFDGNDLPIVTLATDRVTFPIAGHESGEVENGERDIPTWQRWNDYGIALLREGNEGADRGELRQAEQAFRRVGELGRPDGPLNRARVYIKEGRLEDAVTALEEAGNHDPPAPPWSIAWFSGIVNRQSGRLGEAIENFEQLVNMDTSETRRREFDFSQDYRLLNRLGQSYLDRALQSVDQREPLLREAVRWFERALELDPENVTAHHNLYLLHAQLGEMEQAEHHRQLHAKYKVDDNARDQALVKARRKYPAADHAAEAIVIWDLQRPEAYGLSPETQEISQR